MKDTRETQRRHDAPRAGGHTESRHIKKNPAHHRCGQSRTEKSEVPRKPLKSPAPGQLLIKIDGKLMSLAPSELLDAEKFTELLGQCDGANKLAFRLHRLLDFTTRERVTVLDFIASLHVRPKIVVKDDEEPCEDLLAAVLDLMPETTDIERFGRGKMAAMEVAVLFYADALEVACDRLAQVMRQRGITGVRPETLAREARKLAEQINRNRTQSGSPQAPRFVKDVLRDAPVPAETVVPTDWDLTEAGIRSSRVAAVGEISCPLVIAGRGKDNAKGIEYVCLAWFRDGIWHRRIVEREVAANVQKIVALAAFGLPVNSNNARLMIQFIADFESANMETLPVANVSRKLGYQGRNGEFGFLWGQTLITAKGFQEGNDLKQLAPEEWSQQAVHFQGADEGDDQIAAGFHAAGSFEGWRKAMLAIARYPKVRLAFYAALTAPLLAILRTVNFILDFAGETTSGKTVTLRVAASCFGNPDEQSTNGRPSAMATWDATAVWKERAPAVLNNMAFILDDTKKASGPEDIARTVYMFAQGRGRGRGTTKGTAGQETFNSVMISSGEQPAVSFTKDGGTLARVVTVWGSPFGEKNQDTGRLVRQLSSQLMRHYGHAGPRFVQYLLKNKKNWRYWREANRKVVEILEKKAGDNALAGRLASCFAAIGTTAFIAHKALDLPWAYSDPVLPLWKELVKEAKDRAASALQHVMGWANAHEAEFFGRRDDDLPPPTLGWAGKWDILPSDDDRPWPWICFFPHRLEAILHEGGYEPESTIRNWRDRNWLKLTKDRDGTIRTRCKFRIGEETPWLIVITKEAVKAAEKAT